MIDEEMESRILGAEVPNIPDTPKEMYQCYHCLEDEYWFKRASTTDGVPLCNNCYRLGMSLSRDKLFTYSKYLYFLDCSESFEKRLMSYLRDLRRLLVKRVSNIEDGIQYFNGKDRIREKYVKAFLKEIQSIEGQIAVQTFKKDRKILNLFEITTVYNVISSKIKELGIGSETNTYHTDSDTFRIMYDAMR